MILKNFLDIKSDLADNERKFGNLATKIMMKVILAKYAGFCPGVKRAWGLVEEAIKKSPKQIFILGELIHNPQALKKLSQRRVKTIDDLKMLKGKKGTVIIRAHGEPPKTYRQLAKLKNLTLVDTTCPNVKRVQELAQNLEKDSFRVIICGEKKHPEVKAIVGYTSDGEIISSIKEAQKMPETEKVGVVSQTTLSPALFSQICRILKTKAKVFKSWGTICNFTRLAQKEAREITKKTDLVIVIGKKQSSNTKRLAEVVKKLVKTYHIETAKEVKKKWVLGVKTVGLLAGASTPNWVIEGVEKKLKKL